jgi:gliding motility-associated-like protein
LEAGKAKFGLPNFNQSYFNFRKFINNQCCQYDEILFQLSNGVNVDSVHWTINDGDNTLYDSWNFSPSVVFSGPGVYEITISDYFEGVEYKNDFLFDVLPAPALDIGGDTTFVEPYIPIVLNAGFGLEEYVWNTGSINHQITVSDTGLYWVEVSDSQCCKNNDTTLVEHVSVFVPNAFTPNSDGVNDKVYVRGTFFDEVNLKIFNRAGEMLFQTNDQNTGWDGTFKGKAQDMGVYIYYLFGILKNGDKIERKGNITLIR